MIIKKYPHSNIVVKADEATLMIDPGFITFEKGYKTSDFADIDAFLITHSHPDHLDIKNIAELVDEKPIFANQDVVDKLKQIGVNAQVVQDQEVFKTGPFTIQAINLPHCK